MLHEGEDGAPFHASCLQETASGRAARLKLKNCTLFWGFHGLFKGFGPTLCTWAPTGFLHSQTSCRCLQIVWAESAARAGCLLGGSACVGRCVGNTSSGEAQEGAAPRSGPGMRARPLAKRLQTAVFESTQISYYLQYNLPRGILPAKACRRTILPRVRA